MISLFLIFFICIINISYIKDQIQEINLKSCLINQTYVSINYKCEDCDSGIINENICYSPTPISLYSRNPLEIRRTNCNNNEKLTELDNNGNWLGILECAQITDDFSYITEDNIQNIPNDINFDNILPAQKSFSLYTLNDANRTKPTENRQFITLNPLILSSNNNEGNYFRYYYDSCINRHYEQSCQYIANLCTLAMYYTNNIYCIFINILSRNLIESNYLDE